MAVLDAYGQVLNAYTSIRRVSADQPELPWAVYLADRSRFHLLAFDLDAKGDPERALRDTATVSELLASAGIEHVVCASGPTGGRHVWVGLAESVDAPTIASLAHLMKALCPSLDLSPMTNPATGCVRPPGAPHRDGGVSVVLAGRLDTLTAPSTTTAEVHALVERLVQLVGAEPATVPATRAPLPLDDQGHLYLPGARRALPAASAAALDEDAVAGDASSILWRVLIGAASARWRYADVAALIPTAPGLEHVRTTRAGTGRRTRPTAGEASAAATLRRQWKKAVWYVASSTTSIGTDPTFDERAGAIATHVQEVQDRAGACVGRWTTGGGPADRRVLDVLCTLALQAVAPELEADTRRLALMAGIGRETARTALMRLAADGWISQVRAAEGPHGAHWTIDPQSLIHKVEETDRSQGLPRPEGAGVGQRSVLISQLTSRLSLAQHDVFTYAGSLGHHLGNLFSRLSPTPQSLQELAHAVGGTSEQTLQGLDRLAQQGLVHACTTGWRRPRVDRRRAAAVRMGVAGRLAQRAARYRLERELWAWWQAEQTWMSSPRRTGASRRAGYGQLSLLPAEGISIYGAHPRRSDGRADYRRARVLLIAKHTPLPQVAAA